MRCEDTVPGLRESGQPHGTVPVLPKGLSLTFWALGFGPWQGGLLWFDRCGT